MKAAVFYGPNQPLKVEEVPMPVIGAGEILVKVAACGLCHTDIGYIDHGTPTFKKPPLILGHEISGTVYEIAPDVTTFKVGDHVLSPAVFACGECNPCREGRGNTCEKMKMFGNDVDGGYAEYVEDLKLEKAINQEELEKALHPEAKHLGGGWYEYKGEKMRKADLPNGS